MIRAVSSSRSWKWRGERLGLEDREGDLDLVGPGGVHGQVDEDQVRPGALAAVDRALAGVAGAVVDDPEDALGRRVGLGGHDVLDDPADRLDPGLGLAAAEQAAPGVVDVERGEVGERAARTRTRPGRDDPAPGRRDGGVRAALGAGLSRRPRPRRRRGARPFPPSGAGRGRARGRLSRRSRGRGGRSTTATPTGRSRPRPASARPWCPRSRTRSRARLPLWRSQRATSATVADPTRPATRTPTP
jgi:hypothetical protein